jgi:hypothetical protein
LAYQAVVLHRERSSVGVLLPLIGKKRPGLFAATGIHAVRSPANVSARSLSLELALLIAILRRDEIAVTNNRDR